MFNFITKRPLWVNILVGAILAMLVFFAFISLLGWFTNHVSDAKTVPPVLGKHYLKPKNIGKSRI